MPDSLSFEETLGVLHGWLGRTVYVFVGGSASEPGIVGYTSGTFASAAPDESFDALYPSIGAGDEALHFRINDDAGGAHFVFVLFERFFGQGLWQTPDRVLAITQRDQSVGASDRAGVAITLRLED